MNYFKEFMYKELLLELKFYESNINEKKKMLPIIIKTILRLLGIIKIEAKKSSGEQLKQLNKRKHMLRRKLRAARHNANL